MTLQPEQADKAAVTAELDGTIEQITKDCSKPYFGKRLKQLARENFENAEIICNYILAEKAAYSIMVSTKEGKIKNLVWLSRHFLNGKSFRNMTKKDILHYLGKLERTEEEDPKHSWKGTYNGRQMIFLKFFKWLYNPDEPNPKLRATPPCIQGVNKLPRKEISRYTPDDMWDARTHTVFLRYCPMTRDRAFHALINDVSARPAELLRLRIRDLIYKKADDGSQYVEVTLRSGKSKPRTVVITSSLPYIREWLEVHPRAANQDSWLFVSLSDNSDDRNHRLSVETIWRKYRTFYEKEYFPGLLKDETIPESDKSIIRHMLTKRFNPYVFRHSALTDKGKFLTEAVLREHAGWTQNSKMPSVYIHYFGNESVRAILKHKGKIKEDRPGSLIETRQCPHCKEENKPDERFCQNCKMILRYDAYVESKSTIDGLKKDVANQLEQLRQFKLDILQMVVRNNVKQGDTNSIDSFIDKMKNPELICSSNFNSPITFLG